MRNESRAARLLRGFDSLQGRRSVSEAKAKDKDVFKQHQEKIALKTLSYSDAGANVMGGMTKSEAIAFLRKNGYDDKKITSLLKKNSYKEEEIKKLLSAKK